MNSNKIFGNSAIVTAVLASLCCVTPVLAIVAGLSGAASAFSFMEPFRPYFIGLTIILLGYAFLEAYKPKTKQIECDCETEENKKKNFLNSKGFLWTVAIVSLGLISFPYYSSSLFPDAAIVKTSNTNFIVKAKLEIEGMTCTGCEASVNYALKSEKGVLTAKSSFKTGTATVKYDKRKVSLVKLKKAIEEKVGYKVKSIQKLNIKNK